MSALEPLLAKLATLPAADRAWVLRQLDPSARLQLVRSLEDLSRIDDSAETMSNTRPTAANGEATEAPLFDVAPERIAAVLRAESRLLQARVLSLFNESQREALLAQFPAIERAALGALASDLAPMTAPLRSALLNAVSAGLAASPPAANDSPAPSRFEELRQAWLHSAERHGART
jgi:hypothetical protein